MKYGITAPPMGKFQWRALELTGICVAVFLLSQVFPDFFYSAFVLSRGTILSMPWALITSMFMHSGFVHLYGNMFALAVFGSLFEKQAGSRNFLIVFFIGGIIAGLAGLAFYESLLGASGAIYALGGALLVLRPNQPTMMLFIPVSIPLWISVVAGFLLTFGSAGIAWQAHLGGIAFGVLAGFFFRLRERRQLF